MLELGRRGHGMARRGASTALRARVVRGGELASQIHPHLAMRITHNNSSCCEGGALAAGPRLVEIPAGALRDSARVGLARVELELLPRALAEVRGPRSPQASPFPSPRSLSDPVPVRTGLSNAASRQQEGTRIADGSPHLLQRSHSCEADARSAVDHSNSAGSQKSQKQRE